MSRLLALTTGLVLFAAEEDAAKRKKAREIFDQAAEMVGAATPQFQTAALLHLADNYTQFDKKRSLELFRQAFEAASTLSGQASDLQAEVIRLLAEVNVSEAIALLPQMAESKDIGLGMDFDPRQRAVNALIKKLLETKEFDRAALLLDTAGGAFSYRGLQSILEALPEHDPRLESLFSAGMTAFSAKPDRVFVELLAALAKKLPEPTVHQAAKAAVSWIVSREDKESHSAQISTPKGSVSFDSRKGVELFNVMHLLSAADPKRAEELLQSRPALRAALERFPEGMHSMTGDKDNDSLSFNFSSSSGEMDPQERAKRAVAALSESRKQAALQVLEKDAQKALDLVASIPLAGDQAEVLGAAAASVGEKDVPKARLVLNQTAKLLKDVEEPAGSLPAWLNVARAAHRIHDQQRAWDALDHAVTAVLELHKRDTDKEKGNHAASEYWPSTQRGRQIVATAAKLFGVDGEPVCSKFTDQDLALLMRIEFAQILLGREGTEGRTMVMSGN